MEQLVLVWLRVKEFSAYCPQQWLVVATCALGMGVDISDVDFIIH